MVMYQQEISNLKAQQQQAQQNLRTAQQQRELQQSQRALRSGGGVAALRQRQLAERGIQVYEGQVAGEQQAIGQEISKFETAQVQQAQQEARVTSAIDAVKQLAQESGARGTIVYNSQVGDALRELTAATGMSMTEAKQFYEGNVQAAPEYQRQAYEAGIREQQAAIGKSLSPGEKPIYSRSGTLMGVESLYFGKSLTPKEYNIQVAQLQKTQPQVTSTLDKKDITEKPSIFKKIGKTWADINLKASEFLISKGVTPERTRELLFGTSFEKVRYEQYIKGEMKRGMTQKQAEEAYRKQFPLQEKLMSIETGISQKIVEKPVTTTAVAAAYYFLPKAIGKTFYKNVVPKTQFLAVEQFGEKASTVNVISRTKIGKIEATTISKGLIVDVGETGTLRAGVGKGFTTLGKKAEPLLSSKTSLLEEAFVAKVTPKANYVRNVKGLQTVQKFESGVISTGGARLSEGELTGFYKSRTIGGFKPIKEDLTAFVGGEAKTMRVYQTGRRTLVTQPTIKGIIKTVQPQPKVQVFDIGGQNLLTRQQQVQRTVIGQVGVQRQAEIAMIRAELKPAETAARFAAGATLLKTQQQPKTLTTQKTAQETKQEQRQIPTQVQVPRLSTATTQAPVQLSRTSVVQEQIPLTRQAEQQIQRVEQQTRQQQRTQQVQAPVSLLKPKIKFPIIPTVTRTQRVSSIIGKVKGSQGFELQIKRFGKYRTVKTGLSRGVGELLGTKITTGTLAQTFRLIPKGETTMSDISFRVPSKVFTRLKKPTTAIEYVERRGMTLKRGTGEIAEIKSARRTKSRRKKIRIW